LLKRAQCGKSLWRGRLSTVDLLVLTSLGQLLLHWKYYKRFLFKKTSYLNEEYNCTEPSPRLVFRAQSNVFS
jgi:hypothetical protein